MMPNSASNTPHNNTNSPSSASFSSPPYHIHMSPSVAAAAEMEGPNNTTDRPSESAGITRSRRRNQPPGIPSPIHGNSQAQATANRTKTQLNLQHHHNNNPPPAVANANYQQGNSAAGSIEASQYQQLLRSHMMNSSHDGDSADASTGHTNKNNNINKKRKPLTNHNSQTFSSQRKSSPIRNNNKRQHNASSDSSVTSTTPRNRQNHQRSRLSRQKAHMRGSKRPSLHPSPRGPKNASAASSPRRSGYYNRNGRFPQDEQEQEHRLEVQFRKTEEHIRDMKRQLERQQQQQGANGMPSQPGDNAPETSNYSPSSPRRSHVPSQSPRRRDNSSPRRGMHNNTSRVSISSPPPPIQISPRNNQRPTVEHRGAGGTSTTTSRPPDSATPTSAEKDPQESLFYLMNSKYNTSMDGSSMNGQANPVFPHTAASPQQGVEFKTRTTRSNSQSSEHQIISMEGGYSFDQKQDSPSRSIPTANYKRAPSPRASSPRPYASPQRINRKSSPARSNSARNTPRTSSPRPNRRTSSPSSPRRRHTPPSSPRRRSSSKNPLVNASNSRHIIHYSPQDSTEDRLLKSHLSARMRHNERERETKLASRREPALHARESSKTPTKRASKQTKSSHQQKRHASPSTPQKRRSSTTVSQNKHLAQLYQKQQEYEEKRLRLKQEKEEKERQQFTGKPRINKRSKMLTNGRASGKVFSRLYDEREEMLAKKEKQKMQSKQFEENYNFTPTINRTSKEMSQRYSMSDDLDERVDSMLHWEEERKRKIESLRRMKEDQDQLDFKPKINPLSDKLATIKKNRNSMRVEDRLLQYKEQKMYEKEERLWEMERETLERANPRINSASPGRPHHKTTASRRSMTGKSSYSELADYDSEDDLQIEEEETDVFDRLYGKAAELAQKKRLKQLDRERADMMDERTGQRMHTPVINARSAAIIRNLPVEDLLHMKGENSKQKLQRLISDERNRLQSQISEKKVSAYSELLTILKEQREGESFEQRLMRPTQNVSKFTIQQLQAQHQKNTFKPQINKRSRQIDTQKSSAMELRNGNSSGGQSPRFENLIRKKEEYEAKRQRLQEQLLSEQLAECTFQPARRQQRNSLGGSPSTTPRGERPSMSNIILESPYTTRSPRRPPQPKNPAAAATVESHQEEEEHEGRQILNHSREARHSPQQKEQDDDGRAIDNMTSEILMYYQ